MTKTSKQIKSLPEAVDLITPKPSMEDDDKHPFTIVSFKKKQPAVHAPTRGTTTTASSKEERSPARTRSSANQAGVLVTISTLGALHYHIFPIIQKLVGQIKDPKDPFAIKWRKITTPGAN
jgi:proline racemase